jgi:uncharacterized protein (TIGR02996 family)
MNQQQAFELTLQEDPYDESTHRVYADWLMDNDQPELAEHHRLWTVEWQKAKDWMVDLADKAGLHSPNYGGEYLRDSDGTLIRDESGDWIKDPDFVDETRRITYEDLMTAADDWVETCKDTPSWSFEGIDYYEGDCWTQLGDEWLRDNVVAEVKDKFWECYEIIRRIQVPQHKKSSPFNCSC